MDDLSKEFNQVVKRNQQDALLEHLKAIKEVVANSEVAVYGFGEETLRRVEALAQYMDQLPSEVRDSLADNLSKASSLRQQCGELSKLDRLVEFYRQKDLKLSRQAEIKRVNTFAGLGAGISIGIVAAISVIGFHPNRFETSGQMGEAIVGLVALFGGAGASIGSTLKNEIKV